LNQLLSRQETRLHKGRNEIARVISSAIVQVTDIEFIVKYKIGARKGHG
jgi:hypothetical protein